MTKTMSDEAEQIILKEENEQLRKENEELVRLGVIDENQIPELVRSVEVDGAT